MNKNVTSRQELIDAAMEIARTEGIHKVNIRNIARKCSISVGVLYNYFPNKTELIFAVVDSFWADVIHSLSGINPRTVCFTKFVSQFYAVINEQLSEFERDWLTQLETMPPEDKKEEGNWKTNVSRFSWSFFARLCRETPLFLHPYGRRSTHRKNSFSLCSIILLSFFIPAIKTVISSKNPAEDSLLRESAAGFLPISAPGTVQGSYHRIF